MNINCETDLLIIGGGPAGLAAAINAASEGLSVRILDMGPSLGGQAKESAAIENYPGFPEGSTGDNLMNLFVRQAIKFAASLTCPVLAAALRIDGKRVIITTDDYQEFPAKAVLLALGLSYRRLAADNIAQYMGRGVFYGRPSGVLMPSIKPCEVAVVGGANSAGQAVVDLARNPDVMVRLVVRKTIDEQMSQYLIDRIHKLPNVEVCEHCEVVRVDGHNGVLDQITIRNGDGTLEQWPCAQMYIFIGATPRTLWLNDSGIELDDAKYVKAWDQTSREGALPFESSVPGVFVAGDVRSGSTKRIAAAIGEGVNAVSMIHRFFAGLLK